MFCEGHSMDVQNKSTKVQVVYQLSREGKLEHPHMIEVPILSIQEGLRLKDVKKRLTMLRGKAIPDSFSWSFKRKYKSAFIWNDLSDEDKILPFPGSEEYILKGSEIISFPQDKPGERHNEHQSETRHSSKQLQVAKGCCRNLPKDNVLSERRYVLSKHTRKSSLDEYSKFTRDSSTRINLHLTDSPNLARSPDVCKKQHDNLSSTPATPCSVSKCNRKGPKENPSTISIDQETIDIDKPEFSSSCSEGENPARPDLANLKDFKETAVSQCTRSPATSPSSFISSAASTPEPPDGNQRTGKRDIRRSLFRKQGDHRHVYGVQGNLMYEDRKLVQQNFRAKSFSAFNVDASIVQKEKQMEQPTSGLHLLRMMWSRWSSGSKNKRIGNQPGPTPSNFVGDTGHSGEKINNSTDLMGSKCVCETPWIEKKSFRENPLQTCQSVDVGICDLDWKEGNISNERNVYRSLPGSPPVAESSVKSENQVEASTSGRSSAPSADFCHKLEVQPLDSTQISDVSACKDIPECTAGTSQAQSPAIESVSGTTKVRASTRTSEISSIGISATSPGRPVPPGFHKGTNDTRPPMEKKNVKNSIPSRSPPLSRSLSRNGLGSTSNRRNFNAYLNRSSVAIVPWKEGPVDTKINSFRERDERLLIPGLTNLDWERMLQEAVSNSLPPPDFGHLLKECLTCGRTFRPESLKVHMRGCHSRIIKSSKTHCRANTVESFTTSPHMLQTRVP